MARMSFTQLQGTSKDYISQSTGSFASSTVANFIKLHLNARVRAIHALIRGYISQDPPQTASTVADQQFYHYPPSVYPPIEAATLTISSVAYPLTVIHSQARWDGINQIDFSGTTIPRFIFPRRDDFGIYPIPKATGDTITLQGSLLQRDMTAEDVTTTTVTVTQNDATITHVGTSFVAGMVGRWFVLTDGTNPKDNWYRIASFTDTANIELETVYEEATSSGESYIIGESPEIPPELHISLPHGVAADFYSGPRKDLAASTMHENIFWTGEPRNASRKIRNAMGGVLAAKGRYASRDNSKLVQKRLNRVSRFDERFSTTLS